MVAQIKFIKYLKDVLSYNEKKVREANAELLFAAGFPRDIEQLTYRNKMQFFRKLTSQNQLTRANIIHLTLNFHPNDRLDKGLLIKIANEYMQGIGLSGQPFLIYQHFDAAHPHIHVVSSNITKSGKRIEAYDKGFKKSDAVNNQLERTYGLIRIQDHMGKKATPLAPQQKIKLEKIQYGTVETGTAIISIVSEVVRSYKFASLAALNEVLNQFGIIAYNGVEGGKMRSSGRLLYWVLKEGDKKIGVAIRPRYIEGNPDLKNLQRRFNQNRLSRRPEGQRLKNLLDKSLTTTGSQEEMSQFLTGHGIRVVFRKSKDEKVTGVTYIDNATRTVYNGLELGEAYQASAFYAAIQKKSQQKEPDKVPAGTSKKTPGLSFNLHTPENEGPTTGSAPTSPVQAPTKSFPAAELPAIQVLPDYHFFTDRPAIGKDLLLRRENKKSIQKEIGLGF